MEPGRYARSATETLHAKRSILPRWAVRDADSAGTDPRLFICSPHSCEVVKPVFSRSFGVVNLKKAAWETGSGRVAQTSGDASA